MSTAILFLIVFIAALQGLLFLVMLKLDTYSRNLILVLVLIGLILSTLK